MQCADAGGKSVKYVIGSRVEHVKQAKSGHLTKCPTNLQEGTRIRGQAEVLDQVGQLVKWLCEIDIKPTQNLYEVVKGSALSSP